MTLYSYNEDEEPWPSVISVPMFSVHLILMHIIENQEVEWDSETSTQVLLVSQEWLNNQTRGNVHLLTFTPAVLCLLAASF